MDTPGSSLPNLIINLLFDPGESTGQFKGYLTLLLPALKNKSTLSRVLERLSSILNYGQSNKEQGKWTDYLFIYFISHN